MFSESYRGQGRSRSPVMLDGLQWGVSDGGEQCAADGVVEGPCGLHALFVAM